MKCKRRILTSGAIVAALVLAMVATPAPAAEAAAKYVVDDDGGECPGPDYFGLNGLDTAIADAIAHNVHTIEVCPGSYSNISITGANGLKIFAHDPDDRPVIFAPTSDGGTIIEVQDSKNVTLDGLSVNGENFLDDLSSPMTGVLFHNSSGAIQNSVIYGVASLPDFSLATARAISLIDDNGDGKTSSVKVTNNYISTYQTTGIYVLGKVKATVSGNTLLGLIRFTLTGDIPSEAVSMIADPAGGTPSGTVTNNYLYYHKVGIRLNTVPKVKITGNTVDMAQNAVVITSTCFAPGVSASGIRVEKNRFVHLADYAVSVSASSPPDALCQSRADNITVSSNQVYALAEDEAYAFQVEALTGGAFPASINKLQIVKNTTYGYLNLATVSGPAAVTSKQNKMYHK